MGYDGEKDWQETFRLSPIQKSFIGELYDPKRCEWCLIFVLPSIPENLLEYVLHPSVIYSG